MENCNILIIGTDINAYYMARCYHELYNKNVNLIGKANMAFTSVSKITNIKIEPQIWENDIFVKTLEEYAQNHKGEKILLIGANDNYVKLIAMNKSLLEKYYVFNYPDIDIVNNLLIKEKFYTLYKDMGLDMPKTYIYECNKNKDINEIKTFFNDYPLIIKPSDGVEYHKLDGYELAKVYKIYSSEELESVINKIEKAGYNYNLIIQEFIPGDDSALFDSIFYVGKNKKAQIATFAQIGLQEHTPTGIGNCTVLVNGFDEHGYKEEVIYKLKEFLEKIGYQGFAEFDIKYDLRDKRYKVLEINPRQARSSYYLTACGYNLVKYLIDDLIKNEEKDFEIIKEKYVLSFVPFGIIKKYINNKKLKEEIIKLKRNKKIINPLKYKKDMSFKRIKYMFLRDRNYFKKYKKYEF